eukprot:NODE_353_length_10269_cov_0.284759.p1 type:complete len:768 gc:universal NODE_353_length_10269_cov_0.284759:4178-1875(-)
MKFAKTLLEESLSEYTIYYMDYKQLKKLISKLQSQDKETVRQSFFILLQSELHKVNTFYLEQESLMLQRLSTLQKLSVNHGKSSLLEAYNSLLNELDKLQQFITLNQTGFIKILKKWDKRSKSNVKELYLTRQIDVQPCFDNKLVDIANTINHQLETINEYDEHLDVDSVYNHEIHNNIDITILHAVKGLINSTHLESFLLSLSVDVIGKVLLSFICSFSLELITKLLCNININNIRDDVHYRGIIHVAAIQGRTDLLKVLINHDADVYMKDFYGRTCLHYTGMEGHIEATEYLLSLSSSDLLDRDRYTPLLYVIKNNKCPLISLFKDTTIPQHSATTPLLMACNKGNLEMVKLLLLKYKVESFNGQHPIHICCRFGHLDVLEHLLDYCTNLNEYDNYGYTAMMYAAIQGHYECTYMLLSKNADPLLLDESNWMAINHAYYRGHLKIAQLLEPVSKCSPAVTPTIQSTNNDIPLLNLPPPLLPFRLYGHTYLQSEYLLELRLGSYAQHKALRLAHDEHFMRHVRIEIQMPNQLPFQISLQNDDLNRSIYRIRCAQLETIQFIVYPSYGDVMMASGQMNLNKCGNNTSSVQLYQKQKLVGQLYVEYTIISPIKINNNALTYWKSATLNNSTPLGSSSLQSSYTNIRVQLTRDLVPVVFDFIFLPVKINNKALDVLVSDVTFEQFKAFELGMSLRDYLIDCSDNIHVELFMLNHNELLVLHKYSKLDINEFVDLVLMEVYEYTKNVIFSSFNPNVCMSLNWKQPNCNSN